MATSFMGLTLPVPGVGGDSGLAAANKVVVALEKIDAHDHSSSKGTKVSQAGMNITGNLSYNANSATDLKTSRYTPQLTSLNGTDDKNCVYVVNGNLYYNNAAGSAIQMTSGTAVNVAGTGTITGMGATTAAVTYDGASIFSFTKSSGVAANISAGNFQIYHPTLGSQAVTLKLPSSLPTAYDLVLPTQTPANAGGDSFLEADATGVLSWRKSVVNGGSNSAGRVAFFSDPKTVSSVALAAGQVLIGTSASTVPTAATLTGTTNQVNVTSASGSVTLSLPQNIHTAAAPTFAGLTLSGAMSGTSATLSGAATVGTTLTVSGTTQIATLSANSTVVTDGSKNLTSMTYTSANTASTLVSRDGSGNISVGGISLAGSSVLKMKTFEGTASGGAFITLSVPGSVVGASGRFVDGEVNFHFIGTPTSNFGKSGYVSFIGASAVGEVALSHAGDPVPYKVIVFYI